MGIALHRLGSWGRAIYIDGNDHVVLKPTFLTQCALSQLCLPDATSLSTCGELSVKDLRIVWSTSFKGTGDLFNVSNSESNDRLGDIFDDMVKYLEGMQVCFAMKQENKLLFPDFLLSYDSTNGKQWSAKSHAIDLELAYGFEMDMLPQGIIGVLTWMLSGKVSDLTPYRNEAVMFSKIHLQTHARIHTETVSTKFGEIQRLLIHVRGFTLFRRCSVDLLELINDAVRECLKGYPGILFDEILQSCSTLENWDDKGKPRAIYMNGDGTATVPCDDWLLRRDVERDQMDKLVILRGGTPIKHDDGTLASQLKHLLNSYL